MTSIRTKIRTLGHSYIHTVACKMYFMHGERLLEGFSGNGMKQGRLGTVGSLDEIELLEIF